MSLTLDSVSHPRVMFYISSDEETVGFRNQGPRSKHAAAPARCSIKRSGFEIYIGCFELSMILCDFYTDRAATVYMSGHYFPAIQHVKGFPLI